jgi:hypothetical protein
MLINGTCGSFLERTRNMICLCCSKQVRSINFGLYKSLTSMRDQPTNWVLRRVLVNRELKNQRTRELPRSSSYALSPFFSLCGCMSCMSEIRSLPALRPSSVSGWFNLVHTTTSQGFHPTPSGRQGAGQKTLVPLPRQGHELKNWAAPGSPHDE